MALSLLIRGGIVVGAFYTTRRFGVWGTPDEAEELYNKTIDSVKPYTEKVSTKIPFGLPVLPPKGEISFVLEHYYNGGVKSTFHFIKMLPCYTGQFLKTAKDTINNTVNAISKP